MSSLVSSSKNHKCLLEDVKSDAVQKKLRSSTTKGSNTFDDMKRIHYKLHGSSSMSFVHEGKYSGFEPSFKRTNFRVLYIRMEDRINQDISITVTILKMWRMTQQLQKIPH